MQPKGQGDSVPAILGRKTTATSAKATSTTFQKRKGSSESRHKLLSSSTWELDTTTLSEVLTDNKDFFVVGVLGGCGTGKSTLMNELIGSAVSDEVAVRRPQAAAAAFPVQSDAQVASCMHCTEGLDVVVTADRIIGIDSQPVFSPSLLLNSLTANKQPAGLAGSAASAVGDMRGVSLTAEGLQHMMALQLGVFMITVCHLVVVVIPPSAELRYWEWLLEVDMMLHNIPDISTPAGAPTQSTITSTDHVAEVVVVHSRLPSDSCAPYRVHTLRAALNAVMATTRFNKPGYIVYNPCVPCCDSHDEAQHPAVRGSTKGGEQPAAATMTAVSGGGNGNTSYTGRGEMNFWIIPERYGGPSTKAAAGSGGVGEQCVTCVSNICSYQLMMDRLVQQLLCVPRAQFSRPMSESDWLMGCERAWDIIRRSHELGDLYARLQRTWYKGAGGHALPR